MEIKHRQQNRGFTLVEMLVSISLFTIVVTMSVGTLLILIDANGRAQSTQLIMTNLTFALDSMTREIRTGYNWYCFDHAGGGEPPVPADDQMNDCNPSVNSFSIIESGDSLTDTLNSKRITYWFDNDYYTPSTNIPNHGAILRKLGDAVDSTNWIPLTGSEIVVEEAKFVVTGTDRWLTTSNTAQPTATIFMKGKAGVTGSGAGDVKVKDFSVQTTVTQRLLDV